MPNRIRGQQKTNHGVGVSVTLARSRGELVYLVLLNDASNTCLISCSHDELITSKFNILRPSTNKLEFEALDHGCHDDVHLGPRETARY